MFDIPITSTATGGAATFGGLAAAAVAPYALPIVAVTYLGMITYKAYNGQVVDQNQSNNDRTSADSLKDLI